MAVKDDRRPRSACRASSRRRTTRPIARRCRRFADLGSTPDCATLGQVKARTGLPVLTDIHEPSHAAPAAEVVDVLQIPAFLCRQTDLLVAAARTGRAGEREEGTVSRAAATCGTSSASSRSRARAACCSPSAARRSATTTSSSTCARCRCCARSGHPVIFDVTHSLQLPGAGDGVTAGLAEYIEPLARAGVAAGVDAVFMEVHEQPPRRGATRANALPLVAPRVVAAPSGRA